MKDSRMSVRALSLAAMFGCSVAMADVTLEFSEFSNDGSDATELTGAVTFAVDSVGGSILMTVENQSLLNIDQVYFNADETLTGLSIVDGVESWSVRGSADPQAQTAPGFGGFNWMLDFGIDGIAPGTTMIELAMDGTASESIIGMKLSDADADETASLGALRFCREQMSCCENGDVSVLVMRYTGEDCSATSHDQADDKVQCDGDPMFAPEVMIRASDEDDPNDTGASVYFEDFVTLGDEFNIDSNVAERDKLSSRTYVHIFDLDGNLIQFIEFHTSCSQSLFTGDQFGSIELIRCQGEDDSEPGPASCSFGGTTMSSRSCELTVSWEGDCPGVGTCIIECGSSNGRTATLFSGELGSIIVPDIFICAGVQLGLSASTRQIGGLNQLDMEGNAILDLRLPPGACGGFVQVIDIDTCEVSNVLQLP